MVTLLFLLRMMSFIDFIEDDTDSDDCIPQCGRTDCLDSIGKGRCS